MLRSFKNQMFLGLVVLFLSFSIWASSQEPDAIEAFESNEDLSVVLDILPSEVIATMEARDKRFAALHGEINNDAANFVTDNFRKWIPGETLRVAFLGGNTDLHKTIEEATEQITEAANIKLDFGFDSSTNTYRTWSVTDTERQAEIRVSFDQQGFFSLVGTDSISSSIGSPFRPVGGRPNQRSLNIDMRRLDFIRPEQLKGIVRHEFMHALGVQHEHQIPSGICFDEFRFEDDPGYIPTVGDLGEFITDPQGKRPGIFTFLSGSPNFFDRDKVKANLFPKNFMGLNFQGVDRDSIMLYRFSSLFFKRIPNPCLATSNGEDLSEGDKEGLRLLYPFDQANVDLRQAEFAEAFTQVDQYMNSREDVGAEGHRGTVQNRLDALQETKGEAEKTPAEDDEPIDENSPVEDRETIDEEEFPLEEPN